ncbi:CoA transferase (plasmid) [Glaciihabitans sp. INWT7]|uniref:CaiB/BaiF CoA transferase family protein n=1 Tax=Glaciihabitans sp. INWT7 TaxID=2596912 RepID=UPI0016231D1A|nr:CaiB/BaiF CoA-transferase family protein [Glaciihabitans sp. INWT7]QNE48631.1 CoA transferase [Glaciihabitans sp. INWT7]
MLSGIRVISFTHFLQGPSASQFLADLGAEVIKVEPPTGAFERSWSGPDAYLDGTSVFFLLGNRNQQSFSIDLKAPGARRVLTDLLASADVLIESFRPGAMDRLGLGYNDVAAINPRLIYCSLSGYGSDGPYVDRPGQDVLLQAVSGLAAATGRGGVSPTPVGASIVDQHGATLGALGILAALHGRERTGRGMKVESNLLNAALDLQIEPFAYYLNGFRGERSESGVSSRFYKAPYGVFPTADGFVCLSLNSLATLEKLFGDPWFGGVSETDSYARREEVNRRIVGHLREIPTAEWFARCEAVKVWYAPVNGYEEVVVDPQVLHNESILAFEHPEAGHVEVLAHPITYDGRRPGIRSVPQALGASTRSVLGSLSYTEAEIDELVAEGVILDGAH